jgi:hypothetical protein
VEQWIVNSQPLADVIILDFDLPRGIRIILLYMMIVQNAKSAATLRRVGLRFLRRSDKRPLSGSSATWPRARAGDWICKLHSAVERLGSSLFNRRRQYTSLMGSQLARG